VPETPSNVIEEARKRLPSIPRHIAIIMDGNGRWAKQRGLPRIKGHEKGSDAVREVVRAAGKLGVQYLTVYAFSTENWSRPKTEVSALMRLLERFLAEKTPEMIENNIRLQAIGRLTDLPAKCQKALHEAIAATAHCDGITFILALSYSGRVEILDGIRSLFRDVQAGHLDSAMLDETVFSQHLYTRYYPDPDLLIRSSGEMRVSNFLLWQISYAEIWVTEKLWPDFTALELIEAIEAYGQRHRRFGGI